MTSQRAVANSLATGSSERCIVVRPSCGVCQRTTRKPRSTVCHQRPQGIGGVLAPATLLLQRSRPGSRRYRSAPRADRA